MTPTLATPRFDLSGGSLCLDFANTWEDRGRPGSDRLPDYPSLVAFALQTGAVERGTARALLARAARHPRRAGIAFARTVRLREALYRIFSALAAGRTPHEDDLAGLNDALPEALGHLRLEPREGGFGWRTLPADDLAAPLWPALHSAAELLTSGDLARLRECDGERCTWLFLDRSRNRARRWCSMSTCGNRAKARRHYRRRRQG